MEIIAAAYIFRYQNFTNSVILSRCLPEVFLESGFLTLSNYISIWHYIHQDILNSGYVIAISVVIIMSTCIVICLLIIKYPADAFLYSNIISIFTSFTSSFYLLVRTSQVGIRSQSIRNQAGSSFWASAFFANFMATLVSLMGLSYVSVFFWMHLHSMKKTQGFFIRTSKCLQRLPKLLTQPVWTLAICGFITIYAGVYLFYANNCHTLEPSNNFSTASHSASSPALTKSAIVVPILMSYAWLIVIVKRAQQVLVAQVVTYWYFTETKSELKHPITRSLFEIIAYRLGSVVACSFSGTLQYSVALLVVDFTARRHKVTKFFNNLSEIQSSTAYFSSMCPISLGVYGYVKPTNICGDNYFDFHVFNKLKMTYYLERKKKLPKRDTALQTPCLNKIIRETHAATKWCCKSCLISLACASIAVYHMFSDYQDKPVYFQPFPPCISFIFSWFVCGIWFSILTSTIDTLAVCLYEDITRNDGKKSLYFGSRGFIYRLTGAKILLTQTRGGLDFTEKKKNEIDAQKKREEILKMAEAKARAKRRKLIHKKKKKKKHHTKLATMTERVKSFNLVQHDSKLSKVSAEIEKKFVSHIHALTPVMPSLQNQKVIEMSEKVQKKEKEKCKQQEKSQHAKVYESYAEKAQLEKRIPVIEVEDKNSLDILSKSDEGFLPETIPDLQKITSGPTEVPDQNQTNVDTMDHKIDSEETPDQKSKTSYTMEHKINSEEKRKKKKKASKSKKKNRIKSQDTKQPLITVSDEATLKKEEFEKLLWDEAMN